MMNVFVLFPDTEKTITYINLMKEWPLTFVLCCIKSKSIQITCDCSCCSSVCDISRKYFCHYIVHDFVINGPKEMAGPKLPLKTSGYTDLH